MTISADTDLRARASHGSSSDAIHAMVERALRARNLLDRRGTIVDIGCGRGALGALLRDGVGKYIGVDAVRYDDWQVGDTLHLHDLDSPNFPVAESSADIVCAVETIEHLENPWAFVRELARIAKPGGWVVVTTPNQLSLLSKLTLVFRGQFNAFQDACYPAHRTALVARDLERIGSAAGLANAEIIYSHSGRIPFTAAHFPRAVARVSPAALSDNVVYIAQRPARSRSQS